MSIERLILSMRTLKKEAADTSSLDNVRKTADEWRKIAEEAERVGDMEKRAEALRKVEEEAKRVEQGVASSMLRATATAEQTIGQITDMKNRVTSELDELARHTEDVAVSMEERIGRIFDDAFTHDGLPLEEYLTKQRDKIQSIEGTPFGGYLDQYSKIFEYIEREGVNLDPKRQLDLERSMQMIEGIIQKYAGPAGRDFSFETLRREIRDLVKGQKEAQRTAQRNGSRPSSSSPSSGTFGGEKNGQCKGLPPTSEASILIRTGGLR